METEIGHSPHLIHFQLHIETLILDISPLNLGHWLNPNNSMVISILSAYGRLDMLIKVIDRDKSVLNNVIVITNLHCIMSFSFIFYNVNLKISHCVIIFLKILAVAIPIVTAHFHKCLVTLLYTLRMWELGTEI